jgi:hypothetical protein
MQARFNVMGFIFINLATGKLLIANYFWIPVVARDTLFVFVSAV